jgi:hypothetical protein
LFNVDSDKTSEEMLVRIYNSKIKNEESNTGEFFHSFIAPELEKMLKYIEYESPSSFHFILF